MSKCKTCGKEIKYKCLCGSFGCDEGFLRSFCDESCRDTYEDEIIVRAVKWIDSLDKDKKKLLVDILGDEDVIYYLWSKYF